MVYKCRESDSFIVSEKPSNKIRDNKRMAENTAAVRTLGRDAASISLQGVRRKAQQDKGVRFNNLFHHINIELLTESFYSLKRNVSAGVDEMG